MTSIANVTTTPTSTELANAVNYILANLGAGALSANYKSAPQIEVKGLFLGQITSTPVVAFAGVVDHTRVVITASDGSNPVNPPVGLYKYLGTAGNGFSLITRIK